MTSEIRTDNPYPELELEMTRNSGEELIIKSRHVLTSCFKMIGAEVGYPEKEVTAFFMTNISAN